MEEAAEVAVAGLAGRARSPLRPGASPPTRPEWWPRSGLGVVWAPESEAGAESGHGARGPRGTMGTAARHAVLLPDDWP